MKGKTYGLTTNYKEYLWVLRQISTHRVACHFSLDNASHNTTKLMNNRLHMLIPWRNGNSVLHMLKTVRFSSENKEPIEGADVSMWGQNVLTYRMLYSTIVLSVVHDIKLRILTNDKTNATTTQRHARLLMCPFIEVIVSAKHIRASYSLQMVDGGTPT
jgi:hypothetical protein